MLFFRLQITQFIFLQQVHPHRSVKQGDVC
jgi:hypothetical protein